MSAVSGALPIDVVVPVFNAPDDLRRCVDSVMAHTTGNFTLTLIDDASGDLRIGALFDAIAGSGHRNIRLLRNERNLGFTATANRGMRESRSDVVLLNSDTIVTRGWLDALERCARSDPRIATVTPFSNNAEICSFPRFCEDNEWPDDADPEPIRAALARSAVPTYPDLPTGVGFCMWLRRAAIDALGPFDMAFGAGYGEENDFCLRAARAGWRNVLADDAFVVHAGGRSFAGRKDKLGARNLGVLLERHPHYLAMVQAYIAADPLRPLREAASARLAASASPPGVLHVIHDHGGGTETHVRALIDASRERWRHYLAVAVGDQWQLEEHRDDGAVVSFRFTRGADEPWRDFVAGLCTTFRVALVHLHNISGCRDGLHQALAGGSIPYGYTLHDLNFACPTITFLDAQARYCGGVTDPAVCNRCLQAQPKFAQVEISAWRAAHAALLDRAAFVIAPTQWTVQMFARYFPGRTVRVIAHGTPANGAAPAPAMRLGVVLPDEDIPVVAVLGAIGPDKGSRRIEHLVELVRERDLALRLVVIGYLDVQRGPWQSDDARLIVHGRYDPRDLPDLLAHYRALFVLYPSAGPETFSYTLSEAWQAGRAALVPPIGALAERVGESGAGWLMTDDEWRDDACMLDRIVALTGDGAANQRARAQASAKAIRPSTTAAMTDATFALYDVAVTRGAAGVTDRGATDVVEPTVSTGTGQGFTALRVRDALGYTAWVPPPLDELHAARQRGSGGSQADAKPRAARGVLRRMARYALAIRHTPIGRLLYSIAPSWLIGALKACLNS